MPFLHHLVSISLCSVDAVYSGLVLNIGIPNTPTTASQTKESHTNSSLFKAMFGFLPKAFRRETTDGLIAPHTPHPTRQESPPTPSSPTVYYASPHTPRGVCTTSSTDGLSPSQFSFGSPPRRMPQVSRRVTVDSGSPTFAARQNKLD